MIIRCGEEKVVGECEDFDIWDSNHGRYSCSAGILVEFDKGKVGGI